QTTPLELFNTQSCGLANNPNFGLIVGGSESTPNAWPWAVGLLRDGIFSCGGTILNQWYILTAAHCVSRNGITQPPTDFQVLIGAHEIRTSGAIFEVA